MAQGYHALTDKEKQTLRLLLAGHDAKSLARHLDLSVHTVNERLRDARRKLSASSSREAARLLRQVETPDLSGDEQIGDALFAGASDPIASATGRRPLGRAAVAVFGGIAMLTLMLAALATAGSGIPGEPSANQVEVAETARQWLALGDAGTCRDAYPGTAQSFQAVNTIEAWDAACTAVHAPLGALVSRKLIDVANVPTPPNGAQVVRFRARFANRAELIETVSLVREGQAWKVSGVYAD